MANLQTKSFTTLVQEQVAAVQGGASKYLVDTTVGSILRAVVEAVAAVVLWLQGLILKLLATTRASTSTGADLDSWMADFGLTRLPSVAASGQATFARFTSTAQAVVPIGAIVQTTDGSEQFTVIADTTNGNYSAALGGYVLAPGIGSVNVPVKAVTAGSAGNVATAAINTLGQAIPGIDTVTNAAAFDNGEDAESDAAFRARFLVYIVSLSKATKAAVGYAITSLAQNLSYVLVENEDYSGAYGPGYFYVVVNDGTGSPPSPTLTAVQTAIEAVRPLSVTFGVFAPVTITANVAMTITTATGYDHGAVATAVQTALAAYINTLPLGGALAWSRLIQVAYDASAGVTDVTGVTLNSGTSDLSATVRQVIIAGTITVA